MPALDTAPTVCEALVTARRDPTEGVAILELEAPAVARSVRAGQFVMVLPPSGERVATALGVYEVRGDRLTLMLVVVGPRTRELASLRPGDSLDVMGPLGNGFDLEALGDDVALVAGGVGIAPLRLVAEGAIRRGARVRLYYGARTERLLVDADRFEALGVEVERATDDGSAGRRGYVTGALTALGTAHSGIAACGPSPMLRATANAAQALGVRAQLSLEETFACGVGACWGCVVAHAAGDDGRARGLIGTGPPSAASISDSRGRATNVRICKEGPVFWAHELRW